MTQDREARIEGTRSTVTLTSEVEVRVALEVDAPEQRFALVVYSGATVEVVRLSANGSLVVGRDFPAQLQLNDPSVSRQHSRFSVRDGRVSVEDLGSHNGTSVNGNRVARALLSAGDEVRIGSARIALAMTRGSHRPARDGTDVVLLNERVLATYALARRAARTDVPVLITGETGTGKEHLARTIHLESGRSKGPWRAINCATIPASLVESTLFGHERGAFTGADKRRTGLFEEAEQGTVFLDEIAELPLPAQAALLRVLESKTFQRVGGHQPLRADVRVVAATHCDLDAAVAEGAFRRDLLYRVNTVVLELPPLRERRDEIPALVERFLSECTRQWGLHVESVQPDAMAVLIGYTWPGNIRQLRNAVERAALVAQGKALAVEDLPGYIRSIPVDAPLPDRSSQDDDAPVAGEGLKPALRAYEAKVIEHALRETGGNRTATAKLLRIPLRTLFRRLSELGISEGAGPPAPQHE